MIPGDFQYTKPPAKKILGFGLLSLVGLGSLVGTAVLLTFVVSAWFGQPVIFGFNDLSQKEHGQPE